MVPEEENDHMKFRIPLNPTADPGLECDHAEVDPASITPDDSKPVAPPAKEGDPCGGGSIKHWRKSANTGRKLRSHR